LFHELLTPCFHEKISPEFSHVEKVNMMRPSEPSSSTSTVDQEEEKNLTQIKLTNNPLLNEDDLESVEDYEEKVIYVRTKKVGYLIGTSGRTIRGFETNSGAKIDILKPNSHSFETPILLSGTSDSVRNVLRMIIDLYHMNNLSSELWQHLRLSSIVGDQDDTVDDNEAKIYGHEEIEVRTSFAIFLQKMIPQFEAEAKVHVEVGKEQDDRPGVISIGVIGTASRNYCALQKIDELYENFLNQPVVEFMAESKNDEHRLDPFSTSDEENSIRSKSTAEKSLNESDDFQENLILSKMTEGHAHAILQPICKLNSVMMETTKIDENGAMEVVISGPVINVKRAKLQLQHCIS